MAQQSPNVSRPQLSEKGLLTPDNFVVALIDHQPQMPFGTSNFDRQTIINNTAAHQEIVRPIVAAFGRAPRHRSSFLEHDLVRVQQA